MQVVSGYVDFSHVTVLRDKFSSCVAQPGTRYQVYDMAEGASGNSNASMTNKGERGYHHMVMECENAGSLVTSAIRSIP